MDKVYFIWIIWLSTSLEKSYHSFPKEVGDILHR